MGPPTARRILLRGRPGVGKTTVILRTVELLDRPLCGFLTEEWRERGRRMGFRLRTFAGRETVLARRGQGPGPRVGSYRVDLAALEEVGVRELCRALSEEALAVVDEIGKMELLSPAFRRTVEELFRSDLDILTTVTRTPLPFVRKLLTRDDVSVVEVRFDNRDGLPRELAAKLNR